MMKKSNIYIFIFLFLNASLLNAQTLDNGLEELSKQIASEMSIGNKQKIAVIEFSDLNGRITEFGKFLSEELITRLFMTKKFNVVERQLLNKIIDEHKLNLTGLIDEETAKQLGKILGVDAICSGTITDLVNSVKINARLISTETGSIFAVAAVKIIKDDVIKNLLRTARPILPTMSTTPQTTKTASGYFFKEDFSNYEPGDPLPSWGNGVVVLKDSQGQKFMGTQIEGYHLVSQEINFPDNWAFSFMWKSDAVLRSNRQLRFIDRNENVLLINLSRDNVPSRWIIQFPGTKEVDFNVNDRNYNEIKIVKKGNVYKLLINGSYILSYSTSRFTSFKEIKFNVISSQYFGTDQISSIVGKFL